MRDIHVAIHPCTGASRGDVLLLHGFPTSSADFAPLLPRLCQHYRVIAFDYLGYGRSAKPRAHPYSLLDNASVAELVVAEVGSSHVHLLAHDIGGSVASELIWRAQQGRLAFAIASLTLLNGSLFLDLTKLRWAQRALLSPLGSVLVHALGEAGFKRQIQALCSQQLSAQVLDEAWALAKLQGGHRLLHRTIHYILDRRTHEPRWTQALAAFTQPALILWGQRDPVAVPAIGERLAKTLPRAELQRLDEAGHYPQLEVPDIVGPAIIAFLIEATA